MTDGGNGRKQRDTFHSHAAQDDHGCHGHARRDKERILKLPGEANYVCPMCEGVESDEPGDCPKCGMALEPAKPAERQTETQYTCPMHPEIVRDEPGDCPICGMALEPMTVEVEAGPSPELRDMTQRFIVAAVLTVPLIVLAMGELVPGVAELVHGPWNKWAQLTLGTPVVLWAGWPFFERGWKSVATCNLNMFTLITMGTGAAYVYSLIATLAPQIFPLASEPRRERSACISRQRR